MRINVYSQELTRETTTVCKRSENGEKHFGVRLFLASPDILHHMPDDDDRSAVTFWIPNRGTFTAGDLAALLHRAAYLAMSLDM